MQVSYRWCAGPRGSDGSISRVDNAGRERHHILVYNLDSMQTKGTIASVSLSGWLTVAVGANWKARADAELSPFWTTPDLPVTMRGVRCHPNARVLVARMMRLWKPHLRHSITTDWHRLPYCLPKTAYFVHDRLQWATCGMPPHALHCQMPS